MYISRRIDRSTASGRRQFENPDVQSSLSNFRSAYHISTVVFGAGVLQCTLNQIFDPVLCTPTRESDRAGIHFACRNPKRNSATRPFHILWMTHRPLLRVVV